MNPLLQSVAPQINQQTLKGIKSYMNAIKMAQNPTQALTGLYQQNPQIKSVVDMCRGRDPKDVFMSECKARGVDPDQIINLLK